MKTALKSMRNLSINQGNYILKI